MNKLFSNIVSGFAGLWLSAILFAPEVSIKILASSSFFGFKLTALWQLFLVLGVILGLLNYFIKPILNGITLPLRVITLGLFGIVVNMAIIWFLDIMFKEVSISLWLPLLKTTLVIWIINLVMLKLLGNNED